MFVQFRAPPQPGCLGRAQGSVYHSPKQLLSGPQPAVAPGFVDRLPLRQKHPLGIYLCCRKL